MHGIGMLLNPQGKLVINTRKFVMFDGHGLKGL